MERRYFTVDEANAMVPQLRQAFARIMQMRTQVKSIYADLDGSGFAPHRDDFDVVVAGAPDSVIRQRASLRALVAALHDEIEDIQLSGCVVKDIEIGLVDWFAKKDGRDIFLCWRLGESAVEYWHELEAGYTGRRPIAEL